MQTFTSNRPVALITGASAGLGAEFARALAQRKYDLVLVARRRERMDELAAKLNRKDGIDTSVLVADLAREQDVEQVATRIAAESRFELLVNNAGFGALGAFHGTDVKKQMDMHRVHVMATVRITHAALQKLVPHNRGGVINVASVAGFTRMPGHTSYSSTKAWMIAFTECLHLEMKSLGARVRVQVLCPGYTYTEFHDVLGLDRNAMMPNHGFWMTASFVVGESLKAFDRGDWISIPGWRYRLLTFFLKVLPRPVLHPIVTRVARKREAAFIRH